MLTIRATFPARAFSTYKVNYLNKDSKLRFTLPSEEQFANAVAAHGVSNESHVVLYSTFNPMWATRVWWMFRVSGHENVSILDGGFAKWQKEGKTVTTDLPDFPTGSYVARKDSRRVADKSDLTAAIPSDTCCILSALGRDQFSGENASYGRPGRIKGSENVPWCELLNDAGCFHDAKMLQS
jgi:thiosulfate/3-mercaptopyruvate sulfurtransferase